MKTFPYFGLHDATARIVIFTRTFPTLPDLGRRLALLLAGNLLLIFPQARAAGAGDAFPITVRATFDQPFTVFGKKPLSQHSKLYAIGGISAAWLMPHDTSTPLTIPVDEDELRVLFKNVLSAQGFHEITWGKTADIILTVIYGRNQMRNPYTDKTVEVDGSAMGMHGVKVVSSESDELLRERSDPGYREKMEKADAEKLFIIVNAWENPGFNPKEKKDPVLLWRTVIYVDNPEWDLNAVAGKMLAAGATHFDRPMAQEEVVISSAVAEGTVNVGTPTVVEPEKTEK